MNVKTILRYSECPVASVQLDSLGILYIQFNRVLPTRKHLMLLNNALQAVVDPNERYPIVIEVNKMLPLVRDSRVFFEVQLAQFAKSVAWVYRSELSRVIAKLFVEMSIIETPMIYIDSVEDAVDWSFDLEENHLVKVLQ